MKRLTRIGRTVAILSAFATLQACAPTQEGDYFNPWNEYELGKVYSCDEPWPDMRQNTENLAFTGFGCSHLSNLAVQVADPSDLTRMRPMSPSDPYRRQKQLEAYRDGQSTATAPDAEGTQQLIN